jgi:hypothetical protein
MFRIKPRGFLIKLATQIRFRQRAVLFTLLTLMLALAQCTPSLEKFNSLANQGILPLSNDNPHIGANLFLAQEAERSGYLMNFLKQRGGPTAIEILTEGRLEPTMILFYPLQKEVYAADLTRDNQSYQWLLRGPFMMERKDYRDLNGMGVAFAAEPIFLIRGQKTRFGAKPITSNERALLPVVPTPRPTPIKKPTRKVIHSAPEPTPTPFKAMNSDQQALSISQGFAERAENGDLVHLVNGDNEKLDDVVKWYTGSPANASAVAAKNALTPGSALVKGTRIIIPFALVKQFKTFAAP